VKAMTHISNDNFFFLDDDELKEHNVDVPLKQHLESDIYLNNHLIESGTVFEVIE
jgi:hypothetical protein